MSDFLYPFRRLHGVIFEKRQQRKLLNAVIKRIKMTSPNTVLFVLTPTHGNLGDHAIAEATEELLQTVELDYIEITTNELEALRQYGKMGVMDGHPILVNGGGNLGTLWPAVERLFRALITGVPKSTIICMPNTIYYESSSAGRREMQKSQKIYNRHNKLILCARERISYDLMKKNYNNVLLIPDMALSLNKCKSEAKRDGCILCLRNDIEKTLTEHEALMIREQAKKLFGARVKESDMNIQRAVPAAERHQVLEEKYAEFRAAELIITDRLHGMIFAAITGTPCIIVNSKSPKVRGNYQWVQEFDYLKFITDPKMITSVYEGMKGKTYTYSTDRLNPYYNKLVRTINDCCSVV